MPLVYLRWLQYIFSIISKRPDRNGLEDSSITCAFLVRPIPDSCVLSRNETFMNFTVENDHQISAFKITYEKIIWISKNISQYLDFLEQEAQQYKSRTGLAKSVALAASCFNWRNVPFHANNVVRIFFTWRHHEHSCWDGESSRALDQWIT